MKFLAAVTAGFALVAPVSCSEIAYRTCDRGHNVYVPGTNPASGFSPVTLHPGESRAFTAHYYQGDASAGENCGTFLYDSTERPGRFVWVINDTTIATVSSGVVMAKVAGSTELRVSVDNTTSRAITLNVVP